MESSHSRNTGTERGMITSPSPSWLLNQYPISQKYKIRSEKEFFSGFGLGSTHKSEKGIGTRRSRERLMDMSETRGTTVFEVKTSEMVFETNGHG